MQSQGTYQIKQGVHMLTPNAKHHNTMMLSDLQSNLIYSTVNVVQQKMGKHTLSDWVKHLI